MTTSSRRLVEVAIAVTGIVLGGCATSSGDGRDEATSESSRAGQAKEGREDPERSSTAGSGKSLPEPSDEPVGDETSEREPATCEITSEDWRGIDYRDADELHRRIVDNDAAFRACLEPLPSNEKYFVKFRVRDGRVAGAHPAQLSQLTTRRLGREERADLESCLEETVAELEISASSDGESYEVTHPFCTP